MAALVVLPVALAWACAPQSASLAFDRSSYKAGEAVGVIGGGFRPSSPVQLSMQTPSGAEQAVPTTADTNAQGYFEASFALSSDAPGGDYVLQATTGNTTVRDTFKVVGQPGPTLPPPFTPQPTPAQPAPADPVSPRVSRRTVRRALARCKKRHRARRGMSASKKRKLARRRAACVRKVRKKYP